MCVLQTSQVRFVWFAFSWSVSTYPPRFLVYTLSVQQLKSRFVGALWHYLFSGISTYPNPNAIILTTPNTFSQPVIFKDRRISTQITNSATCNLLIDTKGATKLHYLCAVFLYFIRKHFVTTRIQACTDYVVFCFGAATLLLATSIKLEFGKISNALNIAH